MFERIKTLVEKWRDLREIDALSDRDIADLGMTRDQVRRFALMPADLADRVTHMAHVFGVDAEEVQRDHGAWIDLLATCGTCTDRKACSHVLALGDMARPQDCGFCRNARSFDTAA